MPSLTYMVGLDMRAQGEGVTIGLLGKYEDRLVKTPKGWRLKERIFRGDTPYDSDVPVLPSPVAPVD